MKRVLACLLFALLALALSAPVAHASPQSVQDAQKQSQKYWKKAGKRQAKAQKKQLKAQKKATKKWKKNHPTTITTT
ncbi:MAG: hypothetical protein ACHP8B_07860 [Terriglobales bacterium]